MTDLQYVPRDELARILALTDDAEARAAMFAAACRINALYMITRAGSGHIGSSFSCIDIVSWLFLEELRQFGDGASSDGPRDTYFSSKGHDVPALYAVLIGLGMLDFDLLHALRRLGGLPGHPDVGTPYMESNTGSLGMGISKAKGMVLANRLRGRDGRVYVLTGDGELQEGQFWESLQPTANLGLGEVTVIVDHNKVQSDWLVERVSSLGALEDKLASFGWAVARCDGHDLHAFRRVLNDLKSVQHRPKIIIADTVKGKGVSFMEHTAMLPSERLYRFHSGAPDSETYGRAIAELHAAANEVLAQLDAAPLRLEHEPFPERPPQSGAQRLVSAYASALVEQAAKDERIVALDGDLALDCGLLPFEKRFPERFIECGIAEQDMVSTAGGLARRGMLPIVHSFSCFLSARPSEQIYNNATERTKIIYVGSLAGVLPGGPGHSHQAVRDIATLAAIPGLVMLEPCDETEVAMALEYCVRGTPSSCYLRLVSIPCRLPFTLPADYRLAEGRGVALTEGTDAVMIGYGPVLLAEAVRAAELVANRGVGLKVVNLPWLNRVDLAWLRDTIHGYQYLFTLDNHYVFGGQGAFLLSQVAQLGLPDSPRGHQFGVTEIPECGANEEVLRAHQLDAESLARSILAVTGERPTAPVFAPRHVGRQHA
jgi:transketolase